MFSALFYYQYHSFRNRLTARIKRLRQPKYLVGAIVGGIYFYFYFFRYFFKGANPYWKGSPLGEHAVLLELIGALVLMVIVVLAWVVPHGRAALTFSESEVAFLFPAPIGRRDLIHFKLMRSQARIFFSALLLTIFSRRMGGSAWIHAAGYWLLLSTLNLHFIGSSFARSILLDRGISNWIRRTVVFILVLLAGIAVVLWAKRTLPSFDFTNAPNARAISEYAERVLTSGPALYLLYPFRLLVRPYLAADGMAFLAALGPALLLLVMHYFWVVYSDVAFEEASVEASKKLSERIAAARSGNLHGVRGKRRAKRALFKLAPTGPPAVALLWKNMISAGQAFTWRIWIIIAIPCVSAYFALGNNMHGPELFSVLAIVMAVLLGWSMLLGPQVVRQDLRQDLAVADILKSYPMKGWQLVLGELLAPALILTLAQWLMVVFAAAFLLHARGLRDGLLPIALAISALVLLPVINMLLLLIPNAAVLLFPSWMQTSKEGPRGIEVTGQRLILLLGQVLVFSVSMLPAAAVFAVIFFITKLAVGLSPAVLLASVASAVTLAIEVSAGIYLLGHLFERFDLSAELSP
ncbi:MAG TPA: putative ABC exporter domain-containing protein [Verrucomicrobiae bacterium]|nr:putative ABC exporter domain-containing protein [Verrucomicrobiae bacterium]